LKILAIAVPLILAVAFYVVWERKLIGWMHIRHGPMYVGKGLFQTIADVIKLLLKEIIRPTNANPALFFLAPMLALAPAFAAWAVVPFDAQLVLSDANAGLLYLLAMTALRSEEHTSELQSRENLVCRLLLEKKKQPQ